MSDERKIEIRRLEKPIDNPEADRRYSHDWRMAPETPPGLYKITWEPNQVAQKMAKKYD